MPEREQLRNMGSPRPHVLPYNRRARGRPASRCIPSPPECLPRVHFERLAVNGVHDTDLKAARQHLASLLVGRWDALLHNGEVAAEKSVMALPRWDLRQALAWIATRDASAVAIKATGSRLVSWRVIHPGLYPFADSSSAWDALAIAMATGELSGLGARVTCCPLRGDIGTMLGVHFPPEAQPGLPINYKLDSKGAELSLKPRDRFGHAWWWEFRGLTFARADVIAAFPALVKEVVASSDLQSSTGSPPEMTEDPMVPAPANHRPSIHEVLKERLDQWVDGGADPKLRPKSRDIMRLGMQVAGGTKKQVETVWHKLRAAHPDINWSTRGRRRN